MVRFVFLDLDDTLLDFTGGEAKALRRTLTELGISPAEAVLRRYHEINVRHWKLLEEGKLTREQVLVGRFTQLFAELEVNCLAAETSRLYEGYLSRQHDLIPGALELLKTLSPHYELYLASNGAAAVQYPRLRDAGIQSFFQGVFISEELGADKPSSDYFSRCFDAIPGFCAAEAVMVGDSLTSDIRGGKNAGIRTVWFDPQGREMPPEPDAQITALSQLPALLKTM